MVLQCWTWVSHLIKQIIGADDDVVASKEAGLSVQVVLQCQKVSKSLQILTSSFHRMLHERREGPLILRSCGYMYPRLYVIDEKSEKQCQVRGLNELKYGRFVGCCNELALFRSDSPLYQYVVFNPLSKAGTTTIYPPTWRGKPAPCGDPCGFFLHPLEKEYRILFVRKSKTLYEYHLYLFRAKMWRRTATPYFNYQPLDPWSPRDRVNDKPSIVNEKLHWYTGDIMIFDIISEEFCVRPAPFKDYREMGYTLPNLLVKENQLCLCHVGGSEHVMDLWILEDYNEWAWVRKYTIDLAWDINRYPLKANASCSHFVTVVSIHKDELVLFWRYRGMFFYHLVTKNIKKINLKKSKMDDYDDSSHNDYVSFAVYDAITSDQ